MEWHSVKYNTTHIHPGFTLIALVTICGSHSMGRIHFTMDLLLELLQLGSFTLVCVRAGLPVAWRRGDWDIFATLLSNFSSR